MPQTKKSTRGDTDRQKRKNVATKLSDQDLKSLRQMALDTNSSSVDIVTAAIREVLRKHFGTGK
jgi:hypothetical protein